MNHIAQTIAELTAARDRAQELIDGLTEFQAGVDGATTAPTRKSTVPPPVLNPNTSSPRAKMDVPRGTPPPPRVRLSAEGESLMKCAAGLPEPFTNRQLAAAGKVGNKQAENFLGNRIATKIFKRVGRGKFARGVNFPAIGKTANTNVALISTDAAAIKIGQSLSEPFTVLDLSARLDGDGSKRAGSWLSVWQIKQWITQVGGNAYRRTERFGHDN